jgi:uncharacterized membrane protein YkoI
MKRIKIFRGALVTLLAATLLFAFSTRDKVPQKVKDAFEAKFPHAKSVKWEQEVKGEWEAEFKMQGIEFSANFNEDGTWLETEHELENGDLPKPVADRLNTDFSGFEIEEAEMVEREDGLFYEVELKKGKTETKLLIDDNGKVVSSQEDKD